MMDYGLPVLFCLFMWWFSTGLVIYLDGLPPWTFRLSLLGASVAMAAGFYGLGRSSGDTSIAGAYIAFTCALLVWGWHEMSFLMGIVTGPRRAPCPPGATGLRRFRYALDAILYHELAILLTAVLILAVTWGGANQVGAATFMILWVMRLSAKLNIFFGVLNLTEEFLPEQIQYLKTYFKKKRMNFLFPVSIMASTYVAVLLAQQAMAPEATDFARAGNVFLATLLALAILEHWLLVLPVPVEKLWSWGMSSRRGDGPFKSIESPALDLALVQALPAPVTIKIDR
jgi:putative photosynthetic complex assembly protein 2